MKKNCTKALLTAFLLLCNTIATANDFEVDGIFYNITDYTNKTVAVTYRGWSYSDYPNEYSIAVTIPASVTYNSTIYNVTSIGYSAFKDCSNLERVIIGNNVTTIEQDAFSGCRSLVSVTIGNSVTRIEFSAFYNCCSLQSITIPNSVTHIGGNAFKDCTNLESVTIGSGVTFIGDYAFEGCSSLKSVMIPNSVTFLGYYAFWGCSNLSNVTIGNGITTIGSGTFEGCSSLTNVNIPNSVTTIKWSAFSGCSSLQSITIPNSVTTIKAKAFYYCTSLANVIIGNKVTAIEEDAFQHCSKLKVVYNNSSLSITTGTSSHGYVAYYAVAVITNGDVNYDIQKDYIFHKDSNGNTLAIYIGNNSAISLPTDYNGENYSIGDKAFEDCTNLTSITIPNSITTIGEKAFYNCSNLKEIHITDIAAWCNIDFSGSYSNPLYYAKNLYLNDELVTNLAIPNSVTEIKNDAFTSCYLTNVSIPNSVTYIGRWAFDRCTNLESVTIGNSVTSIGYSAFNSCHSLTSVTIPNSVTTIANGAFSGCSSLTSITSLIPAENLFGLDSHTFYNVNKNNCILYVPAGAKEIYATTYGWKDFTNIVELEPETPEEEEPIFGDLNGDGIVNIGDITILVEVILGKE